MAAITLEATIENGRIILDEPEKLPQSGRARVTVIETEHRPVDLEALRHLVGKVKMPMSGVEYEQQIRAEWDDGDNAADRARS